MISDKIEGVYGEVGLRRLAEEQKAKLLPQLRVKQDTLMDRREVLDMELAELARAISEVEAGKITDYRLRKAPVRKSKELAG